MGNCDFCNFNGTSFTDKSLMLERYDRSESIYAMGASIQLDFDGVPQIATWVSAPKCGYQTGFYINYCPKCGRQLSKEVEYWMI